MQIWKTVARDVFLLENVGDSTDEEALSAFIKQYYAAASSIPPRILVPMLPVTAPGAKPQTEDPDCIHAYCEICVDNDTGGWPESWYPGTYTCYYIEHVWC